MQFAIHTGDLATVNTPCLILGVFDQRRLSPAAAAIDQDSGGALTALLGKGDLDGRAGNCLLAYDLPNVAAERVLLVHCGKAEEWNRTALDKVLKASFARLAEARVGAVVWAPPALPDGMDLYQTLRHGAMLATAASYRYTETKAVPKDAPPLLAHFDLWVEARDAVADAERAIAHAMAIGDGVALARELGNLPGNICTPTYLAERAIALGEECDKLRTEVLDEAAMEALGMGALLSVSRGSRQPAKLILMHYNNGPVDQAPVVLVGKGLTFDTGGISIKGAAEMDEMKYDMCGGASVFGAMLAAVTMELPLNLIGVVPSSENMPDGMASKPGDIVRSMSGQTIEVLNTDAEGRLILCDALTYCERFKPALVVDMATLTGAVIVGLGRHPSGLFTADDALAAELTAAGEAAGDRVWRLPLWDDYAQQLDSNFADLANVGGRDGGSITAAVFLSKFTKGYPWVHLDIAGTAWLTGKEKGATGRPVPLLCELLLRRAAG